MHVVAREETLCDKCGKKFIGSSETVFEFILCSDCFRVFLPKLKNYVYEYIHPERLNPEDTSNSVCDSLNNDGSR